MNEPVNEKVSVVSSYNRMKGVIIPRKMRWQGKDYLIQKLSYYHKRRIGKETFHVFDVTDGTTDFRLVCNPENLHWTLEEVSDGLAH